MAEKIEKPKIVPNPEVQTEEEVETKPKFPTKLVRNIVIGAVGVAIGGYVVSKMRNKDEEDADSEAAPWIAVFTPDSEAQSQAE